MSRLSGSRRTLQFFGQANASMSKEEVVHSLSQVDSSKQQIYGGLPDYSGDVCGRRWVT